MKEKTFDLIVIGAGPGGYAAAIRAAQLGLKTAIVEKESLLGGTCLRVGCIPSKALLESSERYGSARHQLAEHGVNVDEVKLDLSAMMKRKDQIVKTLARGVDSLIHKNKVERFTGLGRFDGPGRVVVTGGKNKTKLAAKNILIATGSRASGLKGVEIDGDRVGTSTEALAYRETPKHLVVIGAGYIGLEMGSIWRRLGSKVTVLEFLDSILPGMDAEIAAEAKKIFVKQGLDIRLNTRVTSVKPTEAGCSVEIEGEDPIQCDRVLVATGRKPNTEGLGLEAVDIESDERGRIPVDECFQTHSKGIYAIGDVIRGPMLAHKAEEEGVACVEGLAGKPAHVDYNAIPGVVYTHPEIASVGRTEEELQEAGVDYNKGTFPFTANGRARAIGDTEGRVKILADKKTDRVLGVHILGARAGDLISAAVTAMAFGASSEDVARCCQAHPTLAEAFKEAALAVEGRTIHL